MKALTYGILIILLFIIVGIKFHTTPEYNEAVFTPSEPCKIGGNTVTHFTVMISKDSNTVGFRGAIYGDDNKLACNGGEPEIVHHPEALYVQIRGFNRLWQIK